MDINHIHLAVKDIEESKKFYADHFGFHYKIDHGKCIFMTNDHGFDLAVDPEIKPVTFPSWFHIGSRLNSAGEVKMVYEKFKSRQPHLIKRDLEEYDDFIFFRCVDPDGHEIEVYWE